MYADTEGPEYVMMQKAPSQSQSNVVIMDGPMRWTALLLEHLT